MKTLKKLSIVLIFVQITASAYSQLRVDNYGDTYLKHGTFGSGNNANLYLGDQNHFIKGKFGYGVTIGTGATDVIRLPQWTGKVGIMREPQYSLDVNGVIRGYVINLSDKRFKTNITDLSSKTSLLLKVEGVSYNFKFDSLENNIKNELNGSKHFGFIAQDIKRIYPELVHEDDSGYLSVDYISFIPLLVETVKDLSNEIQQLKSEIENSNSISDNNDAIIFQNSPNPFNKDTEIKYFVPENSNSAFIYIYDMQGTQKKAIRLYNLGESSILLKGNEFKAGMYLYSLIVDNKLIDTKKMILID